MEIYTKEIIDGKTHHIFTDNTGLVGELNRKLLDIENISNEDEIKLVDLHIHRVLIFNELLTLDVNDPMIVILAKNLYRLEFEMQKTWGFEQDCTYHMWGNHAPHCTCDKTYVFMYSVNRNCPLHGSWHPNR